MVVFNPGRPVCVLVRCSSESCFWRLQHFPWLLHPLYSGSIIFSNNLSHRLHLIQRPITFCSDSAASTTQQLLVSDSWFMVSISTGYTIFTQRTSHTQSCASPGSGPSVALRYPNNHLHMSSSITHIEAHNRNRSGKYLQLVLVCACARIYDLFMLMENRFLSITRHRHSPSPPACCHTWACIIWIDMNFRAGRGINKTQDWLGGAVFRTREIKPLENWGYLWEAGG